MEINQLSEKEKQVIKKSDKLLKIFIPIQIFLTPLLLFIYIMLPFDIDGKMRLCDIGFWTIMILSILSFSISGLSKELMRLVRKIVS